jgi:D-3-phosphoglycerate dehydrogenase
MPCRSRASRRWSNSCANSNNTTVDAAAFHPRRVAAPFLFQPMPARYQVRTLNHISPSGLARFPEDGYRIGDECASPDALLLRSADLHHGVIAPSVKAVARAGAGVNNIPVAALSARGVPVFNAPGGNANAVKELVLAGLLLSARQLPAALRFADTLEGDAAAVTGQVEAAKKRFVGHELAGRTLGVVGLGAIGVKVANAASALDMQVTGLDPHMTIDGAWQLSAEVARAVSLDALYAGSDFISFHVPLTAATRGLFGPAALERVRAGTTLLNFSRTGIVDARALEAGLASGHIAHYVTDFPEPALLGHERVTCLPHLGASTGEAEDNCAAMVVDALRDFLEHGNVHNSVNFPETRMARGGHARICVANANRPNMIGQLSHLLGEAGLNIAQMHNASRGELAYSLLDVDSDLPQDLVDRLAVIDGILSLRVIGSRDG